MINIIREAEALSEFDKLRIYLQYRIRAYSDKLDFQLFLIGDTGWGKCDSGNKYFGKKYLWSDLSVKSFKDFCSRDNIEVRVHLPSNPYSGRHYLHIKHDSIYWMNQVYA